jgi:spore coat polysaccharide biosynthesis protein SpsF
LDVEVFRFAALARAWHEDTNPTWREHVTPYIRRNPERFSLHAVAHDGDCSAMRWTVDTEEDLALVRHIYEHFGNNTFSWQDVLMLLEQHPEWLAINQHIQQKQV